MNDYRCTTESQRCVLPFEAQPSALAGLRRAVRRQLELWGASSVSDAAELAVTELAANVIRHVGAGAPTTLVMETCETRVRIELHDTSEVLPRCEMVGPDVERGRGLLLVEAVSDAWFTISTPSGKAVCCELATTAAGPARPFGHRAARGSEAVELYARRLSPLGTRPRANRPAVRAMATDLITDLLHWLAATGHDPDTVLDHAQTHFEAETEGAAHDRVV